MIQLEDFIEILSAISVLIIISVFIVLAWMSTYVGDQPFVATAVVVFQQEASPGPSVVSNPTAATNTCESSSESSSSQNSASESQSRTMTTHEPAVYEDSFNNAEEVKSISEQTELNSSNEENVDNSQQNTSENAGSEINSTNKEVPPTQSVSSLTHDEVSCSSSQESRPVAEEIPQPSSSVLRQRNKTDSVKEDSLLDSVTDSNFDDRTFEAEAEVQYEDLPRESIRIKLKFLDDTQRLVRGQLTDEVGSFKRANFNPELASNRVVRLIFNGQLLNRDSFTLGQYGLFDNCVVHCHISQPQPSDSSEINGNSVNQENDSLDLSEILSPLLLMVVAFLWYLRYEYSHIFNTSATVILVCLTALLLISQYAFTISFNVSWTYGRGTNNHLRGNNNPQSNESAVETQRNEDPRIIQDSIVTTVTPPSPSSTRDFPTEEGGAATLVESNTTNKENSTAEDSMSKSEVSLPSEPPAAAEASFTATNPLFSTRETVLLNS